MVKGYPFKIRIYVVKLLSKKTVPINTLGNSILRMLRGFVIFYFYFLLILFFISLTFSIMFNSNYKYPSLSVYAEAWLWYWGKCLPYEKVSIRFQINLFTCNYNSTVLGDKKVVWKFQYLDSVSVPDPGWRLYSSP